MPSRIGDTIPNAGASPDMWPMTQAARRLVIVLLAVGGRPDPAARPEQLPPPRPAEPAAWPRGITMTVTELADEARARLDADARG